MICGGDINSSFEVRFTGSKSESRLEACVWKSLSFLHKQMYHSRATSSCLHDVLKGNGRLVNPVGAPIYFHRDSDLEDYVLQSPELLRLATSDPSQNMTGLVVFGRLS